MLVAGGDRDDGYGVLDPAWPGEDGLLVVRDLVRPVGSPGPDKSTGVECEAMVSPGCDRDRGWQVPNLHRLRPLLDGSVPKLAKAVPSLCPHRAVRRQREAVCLSA